MRKTVTLLAYAKINLGLRVLNKRPDDFHEIRTIFQTISLADRITLTVAPARQTVIAVEGMPDVPDNLAARAARAALTELRLHAKVQIHIEKHIPMGAGLGGGSSDAAAVLQALPALAGRRLPNERLQALAASLGSDVPFFLLGGTALGLGRGEELYPLEDLPPLSGVLLTPPIHVSTPDAYRALSPTLTDPETKLRAFQESVRHPLAQPLINDFETVVFPRHPTLKALKRRLLKLGATQALMSGSGSSVFGLFPRESAIPDLKGAIAITLIPRSTYPNPRQVAQKQHRHARNAKAGEVAPGHARARQQAAAGHLLSPRTDAPSPK